MRGNIFYFYNYRISSEYFDEYDEKTKNGEMDFEIGLKKIICTM